MAGRYIKRSLETVLMRAASEFPAVVLTGPRQSGKTLTHRGVDPQVYFWRTAAGTEVDFVVESAAKLVPVEVKLSATPRPGMASSIGTFREDFGDKAIPGYVVHPGDVRLPLGSNAAALPFGEL